MMINIKGINIDAAIFDLDGTLFDSLKVWSNIDIKFLSKRGFDVPADYTKNIDALSFRQVAEYTVEYFNLNESIDEVIEEWFDMAEYEYATNIFLKPHAKEFLKYLKSNGAALCTATNLPDKLSSLALKNNGIYNLFDCLCETQEVGKSKQYPDIFYLASKKLNVETNRCMVFEDIPVNILSAKTAGMFTCGVYDLNSRNYKSELIKHSDIFIHCYSELHP